MFVLLTCLQAYHNLLTKAVATYNRRDFCYVRQTHSLLVDLACRSISRTIYVREPELRVSNTFEPMASWQYSICVLCLSNLLDYGLSSYSQLVCSVYPPLVVNQKMCQPHSHHMWLAGWLSKLEAEKIFSRSMLLFSCSSPRPMIFAMPSLHDISGPGVPLNRFGSHWRTPRVEVRNSTGNLAQ